MTHQILPSNEACGVATQKSNSALKAIIKPIDINDLYAEVESLYCILFPPST